MLRPTNRLSSEDSLPSASIFPDNLLSVRFLRVVGRASKDPNISRKQLTPSKDPNISRNQLTPSKDPNISRNQLTHAKN